MGRLVGARDPSVVDQDVEASERGDDRADDARDFGLLADGAAPVAGRAAARRQVVGQIAADVVVQVQQRHGRAFLRHARRRRPAKTERCAGDDSDLVLQSIHGRRLPRMAGQMRHPRAARFERRQFRDLMRLKDRAGRGGHGEASRIGVTILCGSGS